jgi:lysophospholipase L1-like esterase
MSDQTISLTNMNPAIEQFKNSLREQYAHQNQTAEKGQIVFVGSSLMEIFPIEKMQKERDLGINKTIYNRGIRATTTAELLTAMDVCIFDLEPSKIFINIGTNDIGFGVPEEIFLTNYDEILRQIHVRLPDTHVFVMAYYPVNPVADFGEPQAEHDSLFASRNNRVLEKANHQVRQLAERYGNKFINVNAGLADDDGNLRKELTFDGAHMLPNGYEIVLKNMVKYLK